MLPNDAEKRKQYPIGTILRDYFPDAIAEVAYACYVGSQQHNPGTPTHWDRDKSQDQIDCIARHLIEAGKIDDDGVRHSAKLATRALMLLQLELEQEAEVKGHKKAYVGAGLWGCEYCHRMTVELADFDEWECN